MNRFANLVPVLFCLTFPSLGTLNATLQAGQTQPPARIKVEAVLHGDDLTEYVLFFKPAYATFKLDDFITNYAPTAEVCPAS